MEFLWPLNDRVDDRDACRIAQIFHFSRVIIDMFFPAWQDDTYDNAPVARFFRSIEPATFPDKFILELGDKFRKIDMKFANRDRLHEVPCPAPSVFRYEISDMDGLPSFASHFGYTGDEVELK